MNRNFIHADCSGFKVVKGDKGITFTPHLDKECNLSWTNDGGLPNPPPINIKGEVTEEQISEALDTWFEENSVTDEVQPLNNAVIDAILGG